MVSHKPLKTGQECPFSNDRPLFWYLWTKTIQKPDKMSGFWMVDHYFDACGLIGPFEYWTLKRQMNPIFGCLVFGWLLYYSQDLNTARIWIMKQSSNIQIQNLFWTFFCWPSLGEHLFHCSNVRTTYSQKNAQMEITILSGLLGY